MLRGLYAGHPDRYRDALSTALRTLAIGLRNLNFDAAVEQAEREAAELAD
ncbi:hypothetical protein [Modestobacter marinus]|nr:hypothetical protein [Modestobacter marinus]